jgi:hypothetical protein
MRIDGALRTGGVIGLAKRNDFANRRKLVVAAGVVVTVAGVDDVAQRPALGQRLDRLDYLVAHRGGAGVHHHHALIGDLHRDVSTGAGNHVDVALHRQDLDLTRCGRFKLGRPVGPGSAGRCLPTATLCVDGRQKRGGGENSQRRCSNPSYPSDPTNPFPLPPSPFYQFPPSDEPVATFGGFGIAFIFTMYSGYVVAAPPSRGSYGVPNRSVRSFCRPGNGLFPGRKCGTVPRGIAVSVASSHGYGDIGSAGSSTHIMVLRM